ncbi:MAG: hypothetical protein KatS3mg013_0323 [Actinomycetota bacterium]|nr:MAG: hypothetical protein KatS3mg013_0323 [Actinomycetota bacterium]
MWAPKRPASDPHAAGLERPRERLDPGGGALRLLGGGPRRATPLAHVPVERELGHDERLPAHVQQRAVRHPALVGEDPKLGELVGEPDRLVLGVATGHPDEQEQPRSDRVDQLLAHAHAGAEDALAHDPHQLGVTR